MAQGILATRMSRGQQQRTARPRSPSLAEDSRAYRREVRWPTAGYHVELFERRPYLGGRASSYELPGTGEVVDNCQHVLLGCCTNLIDFYRRLGVEQQIRWYDEITFILPGGKSSILKPGALPAPFHATASFLQSSVLDLKDKLAIGRAMMALMPSLPNDSGENFQTWLQRHGQTRQAIDRFWAPVLVSALNDELDRISVHYAALVFRDSFLKSAEAGRMGLPAVPLSQLYGTAAQYIESRGGKVHLRAAVESFQIDGDGVRLNSGGEEVRTDYAVLAAPFNALEKLLPDGSRTGAAAGRRAPSGQFAHHRHPSFVRSRGHAAGARCATGAHHPVDVPEVEDSGDA